MLHLILLTHSTDQGFFCQAASLFLLMVMVFPVCLYSFTISFCSPLEKIPLGPFRTFDPCFDILSSGLSEWGVGHDNVSLV